MSDTEKKKEDWMNSKWRPMMGWTYMATCITDFIVFPVLWSTLQAVLQQPVTAWKPLTLEGAGLFHVAMGAVLGLTAWGRTQEKIQGANNGGIAPSVTVGTTAPSTNSFDTTGPAVFTAPGPVTTGFGGKKMPPESPQPLI